MDAVATDDDVRRRRRAVLEAQEAGAGPGGALDAAQALAQAHAGGRQQAGQGVEQVGAPQRRVARRRRLELQQHLARARAAGPDELEPGVAEALEAGAVGVRRHERVVGVADARVHQRQRPVRRRRDGQPQPRLAQRRRRLVHAHVDAAAQQADGQCEPADAAADDGDGELLAAAHGAVDPMPRKGGKGGGDAREDCCLVWAGTGQGGLHCRLRPGEGVQPPRGCLGP